MTPAAGLRWVITAALFGLVAGPAVAQAPAERGWALKPPSVEKVVFRGVVNRDAAGLGTGAMLYPAPNAAGLLAAILTHGLLSEGAKQSQKEKLQAEANEVLAPFEGVLGGFTNVQLIRDALPRQKSSGSRRLLGLDDNPGQDWVVEAAPVFSMTRDQRALVLDTAVRIYAPATADAAYAQTIRVVSRPVDTPAADAQAVQAHWLTDGGRRLTDESAALLALSLDVAMDDLQQAAAPAEAPQRTFRYAEGGSEKMERGSLVASACGRLLIRTLRGWLMSVPVPTEGNPACAPS
ncbi:MAG: hypothetical protein QM722_16715 [Piscinibacter sp.]